MFDEELDDRGLDIRNGASLEHAIREPTRIRAIPCLIRLGGSGTSAVVAEALRRIATTIEISEENCRSIEERLVMGSARNIETE